MNVLTFQAVWLTQKCAVEYVFQKRSRREMKRLRLEISRLEEIEEDEVLSDSEQKRWSDFKAKFYSEKYDKVLKQLTDDRLDIAHPSKEESSDKPPSPARMQEIIRDVYKQQTNSKLRKRACQLVKSLDQLRRAMGKQHLLE